MSASRGGGWLLLSTLGVVVLLSAPAAAITIDGNDSDWATFDWWALDPLYDGAGTGSNRSYDIQEVRSVWGGWSDDAYYFYFRVSGPDTGVYFGDNNAVARILINADRNLATGGTPPNVTPGGGGMPGGIEYYLEWPTSNAPTQTYNATLYYWNGSSWQNMGTYTAGFGQVGTSYWFIEWRVPRSAIGTPDAIYWQAYYYQQNKSFDFAQNFVANQAFIPEPGTLALLVLGLGGLAWRRRRVGRS